MSQLLKTLNEQRGAKIQEAQTIREKVQTEKRGLTDEERTALRGINDEVDKYNEDINQEVRAIANASKSAPTFSKQEERDIARFELGKVVKHLDRVFRGQPSILDGIEAEMVQEGEKEARIAGINSDGLSIPAMLCRENRAVLSATGGTTTQYGGKLVSTEKRGILEDFYNSSVLERSGALVLQGLVGNLGLPRYNKGSNPAKKTENEAAGDVAGTFTELALTPRRLAGFATLSDQLLAQSNENVAAFVSNQVGRHMAAVKEAAFFHGGGTNEPRGIAATVGIGSVVGATNGAAPDWNDIVKLWSQVAQDNADTGSLRYYTNTKVIAQLLQTVKVGSTDSRMIMDDRTSMLLGFPVEATNAISSTLTKGSSNVASAIFFGNAADFVVGYWGGINLEIVRDTTDAKAGQRTLVGNTYYDAGVLRPESFSAMLDALTALA
jgi:HK97 family phage major capsid protein